MATKSYSKHKEYKEYKSSSGSVPPYTDEQFDMIKDELVPAHSKLNSLPRNGGAREYHYEYKEEKHPSGKYDRKDLHTVEHFVIPPKTTPKGTESSSYYYEREERELPLVTTGARTYNYESSTSSTPGYSRVKSSKVTKDLSQNVDELDSLLDDLQKDQERQLHKSGYTSDTAESTSFDYRKGTPGKTSAYSSLRREEYSTIPSKAPSSGYSTLQREETTYSTPVNTYSTPGSTRAEMRREEMFREEKTESRVVPAPVPALTTSTVCSNCHQIPHSGTLPRGATPMNKVTTTVKTYTYEVPADTDPASVPIPALADTQRTYVSQNMTSSSSTSPGTLAPAPAPATSPPPGGCQYCSHCNSHVRNYSTTHHTSSDEHTSERMVYPNPANETKIVHTDTQNGHGPYGPSSYKYSETTYSSQNTTERYPLAPPAPPSERHLTPSPAPFPRPATPSAGNQQPPKRLDDLLADFPEARFPTQPDGVMRRKVEVTRESSQATAPGTPQRSPLKASSNVSGPAVYYPPGHVPFEKKESAGYQASAMQGGGAYASGRGMYEYESGSRSREKHSEKKMAVPVCLPLCCAMPCVIM